MGDVVQERLSTHVDKTGVSTEPTLLWRSKDGGGGKAECSEEV